MMRVKDPARFRRRMELQGHSYASLGAAVRRSKTFTYNVAIGSHRIDEADAALMARALNARVVTLFVPAPRASRLADLAELAGQ